MKATLDITGMPEVMAAMRAAMSRALREVAADEEPRVAARLRQVAAAFEAGQEGDADGDEAAGG